MWQLSWIFSLIPDSFLIWITYALMILGFGLYVASKLVRWIPMMGQYKFPAEIIGVAVLVVGAYMFGGYGTEMAWRKKVEDLQKKVAEAEVKSQQVNTVIQTKVVERIKTVEKKVEVVKTIIEKDKELINAECKVPEIAIIDYNKAIADPLEEKK